MIENLERRFAYHPAGSQEKRQAHARLRGECLRLAEFIDALLPDGREKSLAVTKLEEAMMWGNAGIARPGGEQMPLAYRRAVLGPDQA